MKNQTVTIKKCPNCQADQTFLKNIKFRTGGHSGISKLFFGELAELDEEQLPMDLYGCESCGHLDLYAPDSE